MFQGVLGVEKADTLSGIARVSVCHVVPRSFIAYSIINRYHFFRPTHSTEADNQHPKRRHHWRCDRTNFNGDCQFRCKYINYTFLIFACEETNHNNLMNCRIAKIKRRNQMQTVSFSWTIFFEFHVLLDRYLIFYFMVFRWIKTFFFEIVFLFF